MKIFFTIKEMQIYYSRVEPLHPQKKIKKNEGGDQKRGNK